MHEKKVLARVLALIVVMGMVLTACGVGNKAGEKSASNSKTPATKEKIVVGYLDNGKIPASEGTYENNQWTKWINQNAPVDVEILSYTVAEQFEKLNVMLAAGNAPDLIVTHDPVRFVAAGQAMPLDDLIQNSSNEYKALLDANPNMKKFLLGSDGKQYLIGMNEPMDTNHTLFIRNDWLKKLNLEVPRTAEELLNVAIAFTEQDPDGNGKKDTLGIGLSSFVGDQVINAAFNLSKVWQLQGDQVAYGWENLKEAIDFKKKLYDAGTVDLDYLNDKNGTTEKQNWIAGKLGIYGANVGAVDLTTFTQLKKNNPNADIIPISFKTQYGEFSPVRNPSNSVGFAFINSSSNKPQAVMQYLDWLSTKDAQMSLRYGVEGKDYNMVEGCPITTDKWANDVGWAIWYTPLRNILPYVDSKCDYSLSLDMNDPIQKEFADLYKKSKDMYLKLPLGISIFNMPAVSQELSPITINQDKMRIDLERKAIVSGNTYTADQAVADMKEAWDAAGGKQVEEFYNKWYSENKSNVVYGKDFVIE